MPSKINFIDKMEIRMGSPYNHCKVDVEELTIPELLTQGFQDLFAWSKTFEYLSLIKWNISDKNEPGFNIFIINVDSNAVGFISSRIEGVCKRIEFENGNVRCLFHKDGADLTYETSYL